MRWLVLTAALLATPAAAAEYDSAPVVTAERASDGGGTAHASMDVRASPQAVWAVLSDCDHAGRFMRDLISCRVLERGQGWEVREHRIHGWVLKPTLRSVLRVDLTPNQRLAFHRVEGDWRRSEGAWTLTPIDGGQGTHVEYTISAAIDGPVAVPQSRLIAGVRGTLVALRREAVRSAPST